MTEENLQQPVPPPPPPPPPPPQPDVNSELQRARSGNKLLKIVAGVLAALFLLMAGSAFYIYRKVTLAKAALEDAFAAAPNPFPQALQPGGAAAPGQGFAMLQQNAPQSSLGLVGSVPGAQPGLNMSPEQSDRIYKAMMKYADRPIVKDFMADLRKNPEMVKAFDSAKGGGNPMAVVAAIRNAKGMDAIVAKYAYRPEFLSLLMEVMKDPEIRPLMGAMPGMPGGAPAMPGAGQPALPQAPEPMEGTVSPDAAGSGGAGDSPMTLDTSVISGTASEPATKPVRRGVPPPVDTQ